MEKELIAQNNAGAGIKAGEDCLTNGQCSFNIYDAIGISRDSDPEKFVQDIILGATMFIGTVVTITFIVSALFFIFAGGDTNFVEKGKSGMKYSIIGLLLVLFSYVIIRVLQYLAAGGA